ncbi:hypothetical protein B0H14DRAFT_3157886 [Mycena olivaceomarginata]|nr:hypothetical protein B0H14DRAFT_3157886 [Mycena olivaceomarginata]
MNCIPKLRIRLEFATDRTNRVSRLGFVSGNKSNTQPKKIPSRRRYSPSPFLPSLDIKQKLLLLPRRPLFRVSAQLDVDRPWAGRLVRSTDGARVVAATDVRPPPPAPATGVDAPGPVRNAPAPILNAEGATGARVGLVPGPTRAVRAAAAAGIGVATSAAARASISPAVGARIVTAGGHFAGPGGTGAGRVVVVVPRAGGRPLGARPPGAAAAEEAGVQGIKHLRS